MRLMTCTEVKPYEYFNDDECIDETLRMFASLARDKGPFQKSFGLDIVFFMAMLLWRKTRQTQLTLIHLLLV